MDNTAPCEEMIRAAREIAAAYAEEQGWVYGDDIRAGTEDDMPGVQIALRALSLARLPAGSETAAARSNVIVIPRPRVEKGGHNVIDPDLQRPAPPAPMRSVSPSTSPAANVQEETHPDDLAVDRFAEAMKAKLAEKRAQGRGGWEDKEDCPTERLVSMLRNHVDKGDPVDVANFAMMLHQRGERIV